MDGSPASLVWTSGFVIFKLSLFYYEQLDEEHRMLFRGIFSVCRTPTDPHMMERLIEVTIRHFTDEEGMMKRANYADCQTHKTMHDEFVMKMKAMHCPVSAADMHYMKEWLVNHIKGTDFKYKKML